MKAISIRQPWAWLIVNGYKDVENRTWRTSYRGPVLIHASKTIDLAHEIRALCAEAGVVIPPNNELETGGIVGQAVITDCVDEDESCWFSGPFGFILEDVGPLPFVATRGSLGFFDVEYPF